VDTACFSPTQAKILPIHLSSALLNDTDLVTKIIEVNEKAFSVPDPHWERLPLHYAVLHRNVHMVTYLVKVIGSMPKNQL
jgi:hypothetical protein